MYRTNDPRFRRRLDHIGQTLESANESAQSGLYIFGQRYIKPCFGSIGSCLTTCIDAGCPTLNLRNRDRLRRQRGRGRSRGRAELSFDFYDDWDVDEDDGLLGWGDDQFNSLLGSSGGYGTVSNAQPARQRGMSYPKVRRKSTVQDPGDDPNVIPSTGFFGKLFGGKTVRYKPSAAGLQEHPGARRLRKDGTIPEGEALLENSGDEGGRRHRRVRSDTVGSGASRETGDSLSSRGDIFPSDEELDDAIPLDDEFAMVLERRTTLSGGASGPETESSSGRTRSTVDKKRGKRPSAGSRTSTRRTVSSRSTRSSTGRKSASRRNSSTPQTPIDEAPRTEEAEQEPVVVPTLIELTEEEVRLAQEEDEAVERKRQEARRVAAERGLAMGGEQSESKDVTPQASTPATIATHRQDEPSQLPTPLATDDESEHGLANAPPPHAASGASNGGDRDQ